MERVRDYFMRNFCVPDSRKVLCFFADHNGFQWGERENLGRYYEQIELEKLPEEIRTVATPLHPDCLILLHECVWRSELGATMTFAHELGHFLQHSNEPKLWAVDRLLQRLQLGAKPHLKHGWKTPCDTEARLVAKRVALQFFDKNGVDKYVAERIEKAMGSPGEVENWQYVSFTDLSKYSLAKETKSMIQQYKTSLKQIQRFTEFAGLPCATFDFDCDYWRVEAA